MADWNLYSTQAHSTREAASESRKHEGLIEGSPEAPGTSLQLSTKVIPHCNIVPKGDLYGVPLHSGPDFENSSAATIHQKD